jgi:hypothetical protein
MPSDSAQQNWVIGYWPCFLLFSPAVFSIKLGNWLLALFSGHWPCFLAIRAMESDIELRRQLPHDGIRPNQLNQYKLPRLNRIT